MIIYCRNCGAAFEKAPQNKKQESKLCPVCETKARLAQSSKFHAELHQLYRDEWSKHLAVTV
ncbi:MAG: hypothetical protein IJI27_05430 [Oscillospiraceae bacterium]|nr:hypothetical protein [Oscillospiraceae bacterium]